MVVLNERVWALEAEAEWCVLLMLSGEGEGPLALLGVTDLGIPWSAVIPAMFSLEEEKAMLKAASERAAPFVEHMIHRKITRG